MQEHSRYQAKFLAPQHLAMSAIILDFDQIFQRVDTSLSAEVIQLLLKFLLLRPVTIARPQEKTHQQRFQRNSNSPITVLPEIEFQASYQKVLVLRHSSTIFRSQLLILTKSLIANLY